MPSKRSAAPPSFTAPAGMRHVDPEVAHLAHARSDVRVHVHVHGYRNGGPKSYETFRVAWSADGDASVLDFRTAHARALVAQGRAGVEYCRGAWARDCAIARAQGHVRSCAA